MCLFFSLFITCYGCIPTDGRLRTCVTQTTGTGWLRVALAMWYTWSLQPIIIILFCLLNIFTVFCLHTQYLVLCWENFYDYEFIDFLLNVSYVYTLLIYLKKIKKMLVNDLIIDECPWPDISAEASNSFFNIAKRNLLKTTLRFRTSRY